MGVDMCVATQDKNTHSRKQQKTNSRRQMDHEQQTAQHVTAQWLKSCMCIHTHMDHLYCSHVHSMVC